MEGCLQRIFSLTRPVPPLTCSAEILQTMSTALPQRIFEGVFASDQIPLNRPIAYPQSLIVNTGPTDSEGMHWCAMYWDANGKGYFYDPLGMGPLPEWTTVLHKRSTGGKWTIVAHRAQSLSSKKCGLHAAYFLLRIHYLEPPVHIKGITTALMAHVNDGNVLGLVMDIINNKKHI